MTHPYNTPLKAILFALLITIQTSAQADTNQPDEFTTQIESAIQSAIQRGDIPGAVVLIGQNNTILYRNALGQRMLEPDQRPMTEETIFDLASLTKPTATATSIMILADRGLIDLSQPVARYLPEFAANGKQDVTLEQLLIHRGGLIPDNHLRDYQQGPWQAMLNIFNLPLEWPPGSTYKYTDVGYMVLAEVVRRVDGRPIDLFARDEIFIPLQMNHTSFNPPGAWKDNCAPTATRDGRPMLGEVHDPRAYALGGVAGHAGLFSTADDLARYCQMILNLGQLNNKRILSENTARQMLEKHCLPDDTGCRSYLFTFGGKSYSARGDTFTPGETFGHTGFTGTMYWMDPRSKAYVILLTNRVHPNDQGRVTQVRREVATAAAQWIQSLH